MIRHVALLSVAGILATGCFSPPIRVKDVGPREARRVVNRNVLTSGEISRRTHNLLYKQNLVERYDEDPVGALAELHNSYVAGRIDPGAMSLVSELNFRYADHGGGSPYYLAAALYAWAYLFPDDPKAVPDTFDPRVRVACELYNRGLTEGLKRGKHVDVQGGSYPLPFGTLDIVVDPESLNWSGHQLTNFFPLTELQVEGFPTYYRWAGIGAPLGAGVVPHEGDKDILGRRVRVPVTVVLRPQNLPRQIAEGQVQAKLEVYPGYGDTTITIGGRQIPLEAEPTAAVALTLAETKIWQVETTGFLRGMGVIDQRARLVSTRPYRPGLIPVVFVHGTASSAARWAALYNEMDNDPRIHAHYQFWFFSYETGNPIIYSSMLLRDALQRVAHQLDPEGRDEALRRMVVIGHSQGGLLTKMTAVESGDAFWRNISNKPIDEIKLSDESREMLRRAAFVHPLPFVKRLIFVATPHHGSYIAGNWLAHQVAKLISAPIQVTRVATELVTLNRDALAAEGMRGAATAVDNMTPGNRFVKTLVTLPIAPGVKAHSIIPVQGPETPAAGQNDGVVEYNSAHIEGVESEIVVPHQVHSCQANPHTIAEVRRILLEHLDETPALAPEITAADRAEPATPDSPRPRAGRRSRRPIRR